jgi:hypothetical protein
MEKLKNNYSFRLQTKHLGTALMEVCSFSLLCDIPVEFTKIVITRSGEDYISFRLFMNSPTKDMMVRIFFQMQVVTGAKMFIGGSWQTLENPFLLHADDHTPPACPFQVLI